MKNDLYEWAKETIEDDWRRYREWEKENIVVIEEKK